MRGDAYLYEGPAAGGSELTPLFGPGSEQQKRAREEKEREARQKKEEAEREKQAKAATFEAKRPNDRSCRSKRGNHNRFNCAHLPPGHNAPCECA